MARGKKAKCNHSKSKWQKKTAELRGSKWYWVIYCKCGNQMGRWPLSKRQVIEMTANDSK